MSKQADGHKGSQAAAGAHEKNKLKLQFCLEELFTSLDKTRTINIATDDPHHEEDNSTENQDAPFSKRGFETWLRFRTKQQVEDFLQSRKRVLLLSPEEIILHAKSVCDIGDSRPNSISRKTLPILNNYGSARRKAPPRKRRRTRNIDRKLDEVRERNQRVCESTELHELRQRLQSLDLSELLLRKGNSQPSIEDAQACLKEAASYIKVSDEMSGDGICIEDANHAVLLDLLPTNSIPEMYIDRLENTFTTLCAKLPPEYFKKDAKRFSRACDATERDGVLHLGIWNQATWQHERPSLSKGLRGGKLDYKEDPKHKLLQWFLSENEALFRHIGGIFKCLDGKLFDYYSSLDLPPCIDKTLFWPFCMMALNRNCYSLPHKDLNDFARGFCFLLCWGDFKGGDVSFKELGLKVPLKRGQLLIFRSALLTHWNQPVIEGVRHSMVLFTPSRMFDWKRVTVTQVTNRWKREIFACLEFLKD
jgi:hypothetical protein